MPSSAILQPQHRSLATPRSRSFLVAVIAMSGLACAAGAPVPTSWSFRSGGAPLEAEHAQLHAEVPAVKAAIEQELLRRGFTLAPAQAPFAIVANERTDCGGRGDEKRTFELDGHCSLYGDAPICRRRGVAITLAASADGTLARVLVRSLGWKDGDRIAEVVDETSEACIPKEGGEPARVDALLLGADPARTLLEAVRAQLESGSHPAR